MQTTILKGVHIGNNVIIGANSLVNKDIPDNCVAAGNPCKVIMSLEEYHEKRKAAQVDEAKELVKLYRERYSIEELDAKYGIAKNKAEFNDCIKKEQEKSLQYLQNNM